MTDPLPAEAKAEGAAVREARPREPKTATVERREACVPRHGTQGASLGAWRAALRARPRVSRKHPNVSRRSAHPQRGVSEAKRQSPDAEMRAREQRSLCCLTS